LRDERRTALRCERRAALRDERRTALRCERRAALRRERRTAGRRELTLSRRAGRLPHRGAEIPMASAGPTLARTVGE
jgi:hypothetical protein